MELNQNNSSQSLTDISDLERIDFYLWYPFNFDIIYKNYPLYIWLSISSSWDIVIILFNEVKNKKLKVQVLDELLKEESDEEK